MKKGIYLLFGAALAMGFLLNACGGGGNNSTPAAVVSPYGVNGSCPAGYVASGYPTTGYPTTGYPTTGYPTTGYPGTYGAYPTTGFYPGAAAYGYQYSYSYQWGNNYPGYVYPGYANGYNTGNPYYAGQYPNGYNPAYNNPAYAANPSLAGTGCVPAGSVNTVTGGYCNAQQICTNMGQPGLVHYGVACYPSCGSCMASVNGACLPGM